jgi:hypothetical protein
MVPFWLLDPEDTSILSGRLKLFYRFLLIDALKKGQQQLEYSEHDLMQATALELTTLRNYLELLQRKNLVDGWSYRRPANWFTIALPEHHRLYWVPAPLADALCEDQGAQREEQA